jgi:hypothetical protein
MSKPFVQLIQLFKMVARLRKYERMSDGSLTAQEMARTRPRTQVVSKIRMYVNDVDLLPR